MDQAVVNKSGNDDDDDDDDENRNYSVKTTAETA